MNERKSLDIAIDEILSDDNIREAILTIQRKKDHAGPDGVKPSDLDEYWKENQADIVDSIKSGRYEPGIVRQYVQLTKKGKKRCISLMNAPDRMLARAAAQVLSLAADPYFSARCFGYRQGLGTKDVARFAADHIEAGSIWSGEIDIKNFFDTIPHADLQRILSCWIADRITLKFISAFIPCRFENEEGMFRMARGLLQGMPLSPLLSNFYLHDLDRRCEEHYDGYCRYGDDIRVYGKTQKEVKAAVDDICNRITEAGLTVNQKKTGIFLSLNRPCFGYEFESKDGHVLIKAITHDQNEIYHVWQTSSLKESNHDYHIMHDGVLNKKDFSILFENPDGKKYIPVETVDSISIYANVIFSGNFFEMANDEGFCVNFINRAGEQVGRFIPQRWHRSFKAEIAQIDLLNNPKERMALARKFQHANIFNIRAALRYYQRRGHEASIDKAVQEITVLLGKVNEAKTIDSLMILEAQARQKYFQCFNTIMAAEDFEFTKRTRRPPKDALNAMISFGNTLLYTRFANEIYQSSLDIRFGILHSSLSRAESLNLDLADLFKPVIVDRTIFTLVNRKMINEVRDFEDSGNGGIYMTYRGKRIFIQEFENKLAQGIDVNGVKKKYDDLIKAEVRHLQDFFMNGKPYKPYKYVN